MQTETDGGMTPEDLIYQPASYFERLKPGDIFATAQPLEIELGCGDSTFIAELARRHSDHNFLGIERLKGRLRKLGRKGRRLGLTNLRGLRIEAAYGLEHLLPLQAVTALHVYFPDPWPKRKHWSNRLVNERFAELAAQSLIAGGLVHLRTDDTNYFRQMTGVFGANRNFVAVDPPAELISILTDFEKDFLALGKATNRASYQRR